MTNDEIRNAASQEKVADEQILAQWYVSYGTSLYRAEQILRFARALLATPQASSVDKESLPAGNSKTDREAAQRARMELRFANRRSTPATADFDLPAENDQIETSKVGTGEEIRNALEKAYQAADNILPFREDGSKRDPVNLRNDILNALNALKSCTPCTIKAEYRDAAAAVIHAVSPQGGEAKHVGVRQGEKL